jgi:hypothetical protein
MGVSMMHQGPEECRVFQASWLFVALFYGLLLIWTVGTAPLIIQKFRQGGFSGDWFFAGMIGFFYVYTWYWSLGLIYRIALDGKGRIELRSLRRSLALSAQEVRTIEGSKFAGGFGFVRLKLSRESVYLFCHRLEGSLSEILREIRKTNPLIRTARI